jgi:hypothetical protein
LQHEFAVRTTEFYPWDMTAKYDIFPWGNTAITGFAGFLANLCSFQATFLVRAWFRNHARQHGQAD